MKTLTLFLGCLLLCAACAAPQQNVRRSTTNALYQTYPASFDAAWEASLKALSKYRVTISNKDAGIIKTDFLLGQSRTEFYYSGGIKFPREAKWKLDVKLLDISRDPDHPKIRIRVEKEEYTNPGFLEDWQHSSSDFLTEKALLYRIGRIITLDAKVEQLLTP